ncbi:FadR/GntR family transcriptional regulator [Streptomyces sp. CA-111067]|uniref:FadR/GntR family transcriptional regulator n=1 Tax=Streptomyces sp. CA-111067 TaxID=3240046 RepID=UPI003D957585
MSDTMEPPRQPHLLDRTVQSLRAVIADELVPGAQLPAEAALAERFGVSRPTIREALRVLAGTGVVRMQRGRRAVVLEPSAEAMSVPLSMLVRTDPRHVMELTEVQDALYMLVATLAAQNGRRHLSRLADAEVHLTHMEQAQDRRSFDTANTRFHRTLAECTDNQTLVFLLEAIDITLTETSHSGFESQLAPGQGRKPPGSVEVHRAILEAVHSESPQQAARAMRSHAQHMRKGVRDRVRALLQRGTRPGPPMDGRDGPGAVPGDAGTR